jgi:4-hydroxy-3-methylbut-2-enyl diphosphate reductase
MSQTGDRLRVILANPRGFCAGVNMAIESLERALQIFGTPLFVYHEIVHNRPVVDRFTRKGVTFVDTIDEVPRGATVLYSAHGVSPAIREAAATAPLTPHVPW